MFLNKTVCTSVLLLIFTGVRAQTQTRTDTLRLLDEVVVTAERHREVIPAQRLTGERLEALGSFSVADAIRYFSGVQIKDYGGVGGLKTIDVRSMGTNHLGVFYDGIQLGNAQNGQIDLGKFSLDNMEDISLYNGQKSEIFQPAGDFGAAGTIYLRTRRPRFDEGKRTNMMYRLRSGSFGLVNPSVLWERKISGAVASSVNAEYIYASGRYPFRYRKVLPGGAVAWDTTAVRQNGDIRSLRLEGGLNGTVREGYWHAKTYFYDSEKGIPGAIVNNVWKHSQRQWDRNFFVQFSARNIVPLPENDELLVNAKYAADRMRYLNPDTTLMYIDNSFRQQEFYASVANKYTIRQHWDWNVSVDYRYNTLHANLTDFAFPERNTLLVASATALEWRRFKAQASVLGTFVFEHVRRRGANSPADRAVYTPAVFVSYSPSRPAGMTLHAFYKRIFRMPTFNDLYYTDIGNIALNPEYATQYSAGFRYDKPLGAALALNFRADAYYNEVTDKIIAVPKGNGQYRWMMMNLGYVEIRGIDLSAGMEALHIFNVSLNYTFQRAQDFSDPADNDPEAGTYGGQIAYIPRHNGSVIAGVAWRSWDLNYSFIYVGERYHNSSNIRENYEQPWYTHDMTLGRAFRLRTMTFRAAVEVNNLFNQYYDVVLNYPMPGRNFKVILKLEI
jgi:outer membrane cobalamin receptor